MLNDSNDYDDIAPNKKARISFVNLVLILVFAIIIIVAGGYFIGKSFGLFGNSSIATKSNSFSYTTNDRVEIKKKPDLNSATVTILRENSVVSGTVLNVSGTDWVEINTVDGDHGFVQLSDLTKIAKNADITQLVPGQFKIITSNNVYLRSSPSLSGKIIGVADGGTRLVSDGTIKAENETWYRLQLGTNTIAFVMGRFTTPDDEKSSNNNGFEGNKGSGVLGVAKAITNVQATPFEGSRIVRSLLINDPVNIIGQTLATEWWYIVRLDDGAQGFVLRDTISIPTSSNKWVYPDGTDAPGPNIPQDKTKIKQASIVQNSTTTEVTINPAALDQANQKDEEIPVVANATDVPID